MPFDPYTAVPEASGFDPSTAVPDNKIAEPTRYTLADVSNDLDPSPGHEKDAKQSLSDFLQKFRSTKIGGTFNHNGEELTRVSENEFINPKFDAIKDVKSDSMDAGTAFVVGAGANAPSAATFLATAGGLARITQPLKALGPVGAAASIAIPVVGGAVAAGLEKYAQSKAFPKVAELEQQASESHPVIERVGAASTSGFAPGGLSGPIRQQVIQRGIPAVLGAGQQAGIDAYQNRDKPGLFPEGELGRVAEAAGTNAILNSETGAGRALSRLGAAAAGPLTRTTGSAPSPSVLPQVEVAMAAHGPELANAEANNIGRDVGTMPDVAEHPTGDTDTRAVQLGSDTGRMPDVQEDPNAILGTIKGKIDEQNQKVLDAVTSAADETELRKNLAPLGLNARQAAYVFEQARVAKEAADQASSPSNYAVAKPSGTLGELIGQRVKYSGYEGILIRDDEGNFVVLQDATKGGRPNKVEVVDTGKNLSLKAKDVGVEPVPVDVKPKDMAPAGPTDEQRPVNPAESPETGLPGAAVQIKGLAERLGLKADVKDLGSDAVKGVSSAGNKGIIHNVFGYGTTARNISQTNHVSYELGGNGKLEINGFSDSGQKTASAEPAIHVFRKSNNTIDDVREMLGDKVANSIMEQLAKGNTTGRVDGLTSADFPTFQSRFGESAFINPALGAHLAAPIAGAAIGYQFGSTPEEKRRNAITGALIGMGGALGVHAAAALAKTNPDFLAKLKAAAEQTYGKVSSQPSLLESLTQQPHALQESGSGPLSVLNPSGNGQAVGQNDQISQGVASARPSIGALETLPREEQVKTITSAVQQAAGKPFDDTPITRTPGVRIGALDSAVQDFSNKATVVKNAISAAFSHTLNSDVTLDMMDNNAGYTGPLVTYFKGLIDLGNNVRNNLMAEWKNPILEAVKGNDLDTKSMERVNIYALDRRNQANPDLPNTHLEDSGVSKDTLEDIRKNGLTKEEQDFYNTARKVLDERIFPAMAKVAKDQFDVDLAKERDYWPFQRDWSAIAPGAEKRVEPAIPDGYDNALQAMMKTAQDEFRPGSTSPRKGPTIERVPEAGGAVQLGANVIDRHIATAAHLVANTKNLKSLGSIANQEWFGQKYGANGQKYVLNLLDSVARDSAPAHAFQSRIADTIIRNTGVGILAARLLSQGKHVSNAVIAAREIGPSALARGVMDAESDQGRQFLEKNFSEVMHRAGGENTIAELVNGTTWNKVQGSAFFIERAIDRILSRGSVLGAYQKALAERGIDPNKYLDLPVDKDAQREALITSRKVVTSALRKDAPQVISRGILGNNMTLSKAVFQFQSTMLKNMAYAKHEVIDLGTAKKDYVAASTAGAAVLAVLATASAIGVANVELTRKLFGGTIPQNEGQPPERVGHEMVKESIREIPVVGPFADASATAGKTGIPIVDTATQTMLSGGQAITGKDTHGNQMSPYARKQALGQLLSGAGTAVGIPGASTAGQAYQRHLQNLR